MSERSSKYVSLPTLGRRRVKITNGALRNGYLSFARIRDFVPREAIGGPRKSSAAARLLLFIACGGIFRSDIAGTTKWILRSRAEIREFFAATKARVGDTVVIDKVAEDVFVLSLGRTH